DDTDRIRPLGQHLVATGGDLLIAGIAAHWTETVESSRDEQLVVLRVNLIAGQLLPDESVVRFISVQRADDIIAIAPRPRTVVVVLKALRLGEADDIEPVTAPLRPVVRRGQQPINQLLVRVW